MLKHKVVTGSPGPVGFPACSSGFGPSGAANPAVPGRPEQWFPFIPLPLTRQPVQWPPFPAEIVAIL